MKWLASAGAGVNNLALASTPSAHLRQLPRHVILALKAGALKAAANWRRISSAPLLAALRRGCASKHEMKRNQKKRPLSMRNRRNGRSIRTNGAVSCGAEETTLARHRAVAHSRRRSLVAALLSARKHRVARWRSWHGALAQLGSAWRIHRALMAGMNESWSPPLRISRALIAQHYHKRRRSPAPRQRA